MSVSKLCLFMALVGILVQWKTLLLERVNVESFCGGRGMSVDEKKIIKLIIKTFKQPKKYDKTNNNLRK